MYFDAETRGIYALSLHILVSEFETTGPIDRAPGALGSNKMKQLRQSKVLVFFSC